MTTGTSKLPPTEITEGIKDMRSRWLSTGFLLRRIDFLEYRTFQEKQLERDGQCLLHGKNETRLHGDRSQSTSFAGCQKDHYAGLGDKFRGEQLVSQQEYDKTDIRHLQIPNQSQILFDRSIRKPFLLFRQQEKLRSAAEKKFIAGNHTETERIIT